MKQLHPLTLTARPTRRDENYLALCDWPGCNQTPLQPEHRQPNGKYLDSIIIEEDPW